MNYPKQVMRLTELKKMGISESDLLRARAEKGQTMCWMMNPLKKNSPLMFDTEEFEKWRIKQCKLTSQRLRGTEYDFRQVV